MEDRDIQRDARTVGAEDEVGRVDEAAPDGSQGPEELQPAEEDLPLSAEQEAVGTVVVGEQPFEYTFGAMDSPSEDALVVGIPVVSADGETLGTVGEVAADRFKVSAPLAPDFWLPKDAVTGMAPGGDLAVSVTRDMLDEAKVDAP